MAGNRNKAGTYKTSGIPVREPGASSFGPTIYVDATNGNDDYAGDNPTNAVATIEQGVIRAGNEGLDATVIVRRGFYQPASEIALTSDHHGISILADKVMPDMAGAGTRIYNIGGPDNIFSINGCYNAEIAGFRMWPEMDGASGVGINIGNTAGSYGCWIHDNAFINVEAAEMGCSVRMGSEDYECQYILIEDNLFHCGGSVTNGTGIVQWSHSTRSMVRRNHFDIIRNAATSAGIFMEPIPTNAAGAPRGRILDNTFNGTEVGVSDMVAQAVYSHQAMAGGDFIIAGNQTVNLDAPYNAYVLLDVVMGANYIENELADPA